jgi:lactate permease
VLLLIQSLPLLLLVGLLALGRATPPVAAAAALAASLPAIALTLPGSLGGFLAMATLQGAWLALAPIAVVTAGLLFHGAVARPAAAAPVPATRSMLFATAFLAGPFLESVTGFAVGVVFALGQLRAAGLRGPAAIAVGLYALLLVPWGGLGPGTFLGAALAGVDVGAMARANAWLTAAWLPAMLAIFWRLAGALGLPGDAATRARELAWVLALGGLLVGAHSMLPVELCGIAATAPLLLARHRARLADPAAGRAALPYLALTAALLGSHLLPGLGPWLTAAEIRPFPGLPGIAMNHAAVVLGAVAAALLAMRADAPHVMRAALSRARRPALAMLLFVVLARWLAASGVAGSLAGALACAAGTAAPFTAPVLAGAVGFFIGSNVGSNSATMPLVAALAAGSALPPALLPAIQNFCGSACTMLSAPALALGFGVGGERADPAAVWRLLWPLAPAAVGVSWGAIALGRLAVGA